MSHFGDDKAFSALLETYLRTSSEEERSVIDKEVWDKYGVERVVFVLDMAGFSRLTEKHGIVRYLAAVRQMQLAATPVIERYKGAVAKFEADNCFAHFPDVHNAIQAAIAINFALDAMNILTVDELDIYVSIGIDLGQILLIENEEYFGAAVNVASKLGEDIASEKEILVTDAAMVTLPEDAGVKSETVKFEISGITIDAHRILY
jgi:adenylate cyclase